jgi:hypothetical protein
MVYGHHHDFVNNYRWPWICSVCLSRTMSFFSLSNISQSLSWLIIAFFRRENTASTVPPMDQELHTCRAPDFAHVFSGACVVHFVQVHAFTYFIMYIYVHLCTYSSVQHDFNTSIKWCSCRLIVTWRVLLAEQELPTLLEHLSSSWFLVGLVLVNLQFS